MRNSSRGAGLRRVAALAVGLGGLAAAAGPARAQLSQCVEGPYRVLCYTGTEANPFNRSLWNAAAKNANNQGRFFLDFNQRVEDAPFGPPDAPDGLDVGPFTLRVENGPFCSPPFPACESNYIDIEGVPPFDPIINFPRDPYVRCSINCEPDPASTAVPPTCLAEESITVRLTFAPSLALNAFGADFTRTDSGERVDMQLILSDGATILVPVAPVVGSLLSGFFGVLVEGLGSSVSIREIRFVPRTHLEDPVQGRLGEKFGIDNVGNIPDCLDGLDNDEDGLTDFAIDPSARDPGCHSPADLTEVADCDNGVDDDFDGAIDLADPGCRDAADGSEGVDCADGIDNDVDSRADFSATEANRDPGCADANDPDEGDTDLACDDGIDNDCDGLIDFGVGPGRDPGCSFTDDVPGAPAPDGEIDSEVACDDGVENEPAPDPGPDGFIDFSASTDPACAGHGDPECSFATDLSELFDCADGLDNDGDGLTDFGVGGDGHCNNADDPSEQPDCADGLDNDADGDTDFPAEADCRAASDPSEVPDCADGLDNDDDDLVDFGADAGCADAQDQIELFDCEDGVDNDGDRLVDSLGGDPGCDGAQDGRETDPDLACDDGVDNDGDGFTDARLFPALGDPGCSDPELDGSEQNPQVQCDNGQDDDGDLGIDVGGGGAGGAGDLQCSSPLDDIEELNCSDGLDNDGDGLVDFGEDPDCESAADDDESVDCGVDDTDSDGDGVCNRDDNCLFVANREQYDTNGNGFGNNCDSDYDADGIVGGTDFNALKAALGSVSGEARYDQNADNECDGAIGSPDLRTFRRSFGLPPGPSGCLLLGGACAPAGDCPLLP